MPVVLGRLKAVSTLQSCKKANKRDRKKRKLLAREVLAVLLVAISFHTTTWLTIHNVKLAGYAIMER